MCLLRYVLAVLRFIHGMLTMGGIGRAGLDIDALRDVAKAVNGLKTPASATIMITHYKRLLNLIQPDFVHVMEAGRIMYSGDISVADVLEKDGYEGVRQLLNTSSQPQAVAA